MALQFARTAILSPPSNKYTCQQNVGTTEQVKELLDRVKVPVSEAFPDTRKIGQMDTDELDLMWASQK